jgi:SpoVK/Ycf46/Vps4 family AAA+-type ATPase
MAILSRLTANDSVTFDVNALAERTPGFTGADMTSLYEAATNVRIHATFDSKMLDSAESVDAILSRLGPLTLEHMEIAADRISKKLLPRSQPTPVAPSV